MGDTRFEQIALFEHRFWLQVLGDHARFILESLSAHEVEEIRRAQYFRDIFDKLLVRARDPLTPGSIEELGERAHRSAEQMREFKLHLLRRHLVGEISMALSPSFLNHTVNELEEYLRILRYLQTGESPPSVHPVHHHLIWLQDAFGHASILRNAADFIEKDVIRKSERFTLHFEEYYLKAVEIAGYLRTDIDRFPALTRFNSQVELEMNLFRGFLQEIEDMELGDEVLGNLSPLLPDHMAREECYYLLKLAEVSETHAPVCDPTKPRVQE